MDNVGIIIQKLNGGGAERVAANLSRELRKKYHVHLIVFDADDITYKYGGILYDLKMPAKKGIFNKIINFIRRVKKVRKIKKENNIKCTVSFMAGANFVNILSKKKDKIVVSTRNTMSAFGVNLFSKCRERFLAKFSDIEITVSNIVKQDLITQFNINPNKLRTIYNFTDLNFIKENCNEKMLYDEVNFDKKCRYIITVGRLDEQKAQWHIIRAFNELIKDNRYHNIRLIILGKGQLEDKLKDIVKSYKIEDKVKFLGFVKNPHYYINKSELFVFSSLFEGFSNSLVEAIACGKVVISTKCGIELLAPEKPIDVNIQETYWGKYGVIVPEFDLNNFDAVSELTRAEKILVQTIKTILDEKEKLDYYCQQAANRANDFSTNKIINEWIEVIETKERKCEK